MLKSGGLWVDGARYRGDLRIVRRGDAQLSVLNVVDLEDYVSDSLAAEMPDAAPSEARLAQAIALRSFALFQIKAAPAGREYDLHDGLLHAGYRGIEYRDAAGRSQLVETAEAREITARCRGLVLAYQGRLFWPYMTAACGGRTLSGSAIFSAAPTVASVACEHCRESSDYRWKTTLSWPDAVSHLETWAERRGWQIGSPRTIEVIESRRAALAEVRIRGSDGEKVVSAYDMYRDIGPAFGLRSPRFTIERAGQQVIVQGRGAGHGVGLCQAGAMALAREGHNAGEILQYYFPGSEIRPLQL